MLASGAGSEARAAIGWVVFAGLGLAAVFNLLLTPVIYAALSRSKLESSETNSGDESDRGQLSVQS